MDEISEVGSVDKGDRRQAAGVDNKKICPTVKETPEATVGFGEIDIHSASFRHHRTQLCICKCAAHSHYSAEHPHEND